MKNNNTIVSCMFFVSLLLFHVLQAHSAEQSPVALKEKSHLLQSEIQTISKSIKLKENQLSSLQKKIFTADAQIEKLGQIQLEITGKQALTQAKLIDLEREKSQLLTDIESSNQSLSHLARAFYILQMQRPLKMLINQEDAGKSGRYKIYHDYLIKDYLQQNLVLNAQYIKRDSLDKSLSNQMLELKQLAEKNARQTLSLQNSYEERSAALEKLAAEIKSDTSRIELLKADQKRLEKLAEALAKLQQIKSSGMSFAKQKGELSWPVTGQVVQTFGQIRAGSKLKWRGVLIETQAGASVNAVSKGQIIFADWLTGYGFVTILEHGHGYMSLYAHNQQLLVKVGDQIKEDQQIALAGNSGRSGKPALYFEIRYKGKPVNPAKWIVARKSH